LLYSEKAGEGMHFVVALDAATEGGTVRAEGNRLLVKGATACHHRAECGDRFPRLRQDSRHRSASNQDFVQSQDLDAAVKRGYGDLLRRHTSDYRALFDRVSLDLGGGVDAQLPTGERLKQFEAALTPRCWLSISNTVATC